MPSFKQILVLYLGLALLGCSTESQKKKGFAFNSPHEDEQHGNFQVDTFRVVRSVRAGANSYDITTKKTFNFQACLVDPGADRIGMPNLQFAIEDESGNQIVRVTDDNGCLHWSETPSFDFFEDETFYPFVRIIRSNNLYRGFVIVRRAFNPWIDGPGALVNPLTEDLPENSQIQEMEPQAGGLKNAYFRTKNRKRLGFNVRDVSFAFKGLDLALYEVSPSLNLTVAHKYQVQLQPQVLRQTIDQADVPQVLTRGRLKAVFVLLRESSNETTQYSLNNVVASAEFEGELNGGIFNTNFSMQFPTVADLMSRTVGLLTLIPKEEIQGLPKMSFEGPVNPGNLGRVMLRPTTVDAVSLHQKFQQKLALNRQPSLKPVELFQLQTGYRTLAVKAPNAAVERDLRQPLESLLAQSRPFSRGQTDLANAVACEYAFQDSSRRRALEQRCRFQRNFFDVLPLTFVERLNSNRPKIVAIQPTETMQMNMGFQMTDVTTQSAGYNIKAGLTLSPANQLGLDILTQGRLGFNLSINGDYSWGRVVQKQNSQGIVVNRSRSVTAEGVTYEIKADTRRCLILSPAEWVMKFYKDEPIKGLVYCSQNLKAQDTRYETYYLVNSQPGRDGSPYVDNASLELTPWRMLIRGNELFGLFKTIAEKPMYSLMLSRVPEETELHQRFSLMYEKGATQLIPGAFLD
ncbi:MAG: hypothetical protein ACK5Y2_08420 [Bdellovibrionales bacterium]